MTTDLTDQQAMRGRTAIVVARDQHVAEVRERGRRTDGVSVALAAARAQRGLVALLLLLAGLAWWATVNQTAGMASGPGADLGSLPWFVGIWIAMMAAMMLPSVAPTVALYARMSRSRGLARPLVFTAACLMVWSVVGLGSYGMSSYRRSHPCVEDALEVLTQTHRIHRREARQPLNEGARR